MHEEKARIIEKICLLTILLIVSLIGNFWQHRLRDHQITNCQNEISALSNAENAGSDDVIMDLDFLQNQKAQLEPDALERTNQAQVIYQFVHAYYNTSNEAEQTRIKRVQAFVTDALLAMMLDALDSNPGGNYHLSLTATNINIYYGNENEFLVTFNVLDSQKF